MDRRTLSGRRNGEVVHAHQLDAVLNNPGGCIIGEPDHILMKAVVAGMPPLGISGADEQALDRRHDTGSKNLGRNARLVGQVDDERGSDQNVERQTLAAGAVGHEMERRIDVRTGVHAH